MPFSVKDWKDYPDTSTPITQAALEDMETRLSNFTAGRTPISVADYGAKGDGVTDDTAAIQAAINAAGTVGQVFFPATSTRYKAGVLSVPQLVKFVGPGAVQFQGTKLWREPYGNNEQAVTLSVGAGYYIGNTANSGIVGVSGGDISTSAERGIAAADLSVSSHPPTLTTSDTTFTSTTVTFGNTVTSDQMAALRPGMRIDAVSGSDVWNFGDNSVGATGRTTGIVGSVSGNVVTLDATWGWRRNGSVVSPPSAATTVWVNRVNKVWALNINTFRQAPAVTPSYTGVSAKFSSVMIEAGAYSDLNVTGTGVGYGTESAPAVWGVDSVFLGGGGTGGIAHLARGGWWTGFAAGGMTAGGYHFLAHSGWGGAGNDVAFFDKVSGAAVGFQSTADSSTRPAIAVFVNPDTQPRFTIRQDGRLAWGPGGSSGVDAYIARGSDGSLVLDSVSVSTTGNVSVGGSGKGVGFYGSGGAVKQTVSGSRGGNAALASLLTALAAYGLITDSSS